MAGPIEALETEEDAVKAADACGYPVMLKASAGGGGIGFILQQNINLLNYRAASTQMAALEESPFFMGRSVL